MRQEEVEYWEEQAQKEDDGLIRDNIWKRVEIVRRLLREPLIGKKILEVGVGPCTTFGAINVVLLGSFHYVGTDLSPTRCAQVGDMFGFKIHHTDITKLPGKDGEYDYVVALDVLEHVNLEDRVNGFVEIKRVLAPGGKLIANIPVDDRPHGEFDYGFGKGDWRALCKTAGLEDIVIEPYNIKGPDGKEQRYLFARAQKRAPQRMAYIVTLWDNVWVPLYTKALKKRGFGVHVGPLGTLPSPPDVVFHMWADRQIDPAVFPSHVVNLLFMRRYEFYYCDWKGYDWSRIDRMFFCNTFIKAQVDEYFKKEGISVPTELVYNAVDVDAWTFAERNANHRIGMACHVHPKKNLALAVQILAMLPEEFELHIAGEVQDPATREYLRHMSILIQRKIILYGHVPHETLDKWWEDKGFCLSTSITEGNPNNVLESVSPGDDLLHGGRRLRPHPGACLRFSFLSQLCQEPLRPP